MILRETTSEERCDLVLSLMRYHGLQTRHDTSLGLQRRITLTARVDSPRIPGGPDFSAPHFHQKLVGLVILSPPDSKWLAKIGETHNVPNPCGEVAVSAGVEPDRSENDGETAESIPVEVMLSVSAEAIDAIRNQAVTAHDHGRPMDARLTLAGSSLPNNTITLSDLDVSEPRSYAVSQFYFHDGDGRDWA